MQFLSGFELYSRWVPLTFYVYGYTTRTRTPTSGYLKVSNGLLTDPLGGSSLLKYIIINQIKLFTNYAIYN